MALVSSGVSHLPILDESGRVIGMFPETRNVSPTTLGNVVVIMAGGLGMRLRPMTDTIPKPMLRVAGKPMLEHIVENLRLEGFTDFIISINYLGEILMASGIALAVGYPGAIWPWLYPLYYVVLLFPRERDDDRRCAAKYGALWQEYTSRVKHRIIPYIY